MKTRNLALPLAVLVFASSQMACYGKFALVRKVHQLNGEITENKYVHSLMTWVFVIVPVYGIAGVADFVVLNVIEFWSGENPVSASTSVESDGTTVSMNQSLKDGIDTLEITRSAGGVVLGRVEITKVDGGVLRAVSFSANGSVERSQVFPMNEVGAGRLAEAAK